MSVESESQEPQRYKRLAINQVKEGSRISIITTDGYRITFRVEKSRNRDRMDSVRTVFMDGIVEESNFRHVSVGAVILLNLSSPLVEDEICNLIYEIPRHDSRRCVLKPLQILGTNVDDDYLSCEMEQEILPALEEIADFLDVDMGDKTMPIAIRLLGGVVVIEELAEQGVSARLNQALLKIAKTREDIVFDLDSTELVDLFRRIAEYMVIWIAGFRRIGSSAIQIRKTIQSQDGYSFELEITYDGEYITYCRLRGPMQAQGEWIN